MLSLPTGWTDVDIGSPSLAGSASCTSPWWSVSGSGSDIQNTSDQFNFAYATQTGPCTMLTEVNSLSGSNGLNSSAKAGIMFRSDTTAGAANVAMLATPGSGVTFQYRSSAGGGTSSVQVSGINTPIWVELVRNGNNFSGYYSTDQVNWTQVGATQTIAMNSSLLAGLAVTSHDNTSLCTAWFVYATVFPYANLPPGYYDYDIGSPGLAGSAAYVSSTSTYTVDGSGADIQGTSDQFNFLTGPAVSGSATYEAEVSSMTNTNPWAKAGVMFRTDTTAGSANVAMLATPGEGVTFQWRSSAGSGTSYVQAGGNTPIWVELVCNGDNFSGYYSTDGGNWTQVGTTQSISLGTQYLAGLAVTAHDNTQLCTASFSNVAIKQGLTSPSITENTAAQMQAAYYVNGLTFNGTAANGLGETIAILENGGDATNFSDTGTAGWATSDMALFDQGMGISDPQSFTKMGVSSSGQLTTTLPAAVSGFDFELALDVEWAHAMAPKANILLVENTSSSWTAEVAIDAYTAANPSMHICAVTESFGLSESFYGSTAAEEGVDADDYDNAGIVHCAASDDSGANNGSADYPATSPNALAVGELNTAFNSTTGAMTGETSTSGSGCGISAYESQPLYQDGKVNGISSSVRVEPDIALAGGYAGGSNYNGGTDVYDSEDFGVGTGWSTFGAGGTSLASPLMAGLVADIDQGQLLNGLAPMSSAGGAGIAAINPNNLPSALDIHTLLYNCLSYSNSDFNDITSGPGAANAPSNGVNWNPMTGYDLPSGLESARPEFCYGPGNDQSAVCHFQSRESDV